MSALRDAALDAVAECLRHPDRCEELAGFFDDMAKDDERWIDDAIRRNRHGEAERLREQRRGADMACRLMHALAALGTEAGQ